ncbi:MAG: histidine kinase [Bacteroidales bacterium]|nr:histidine kinase [Bacteroidales bacterium]
MRKKLYTLCFLLFSLSGNSQLSLFSPFFYNQAVYYSFLDSKNFLWICTENGVYRFDGNEVKSFSTFNGLVDNVVFKAVEDKNGHIWFKTFKPQICFYDYFQDKILQNTKINDIVSWFNKNQSVVYELGVDTSNNLFYSYINEILTINLNSYKFKYNKGIIITSSNNMYYTNLQDIKDINHSLVKELINKVTAHFPIEKIYVSENNSYKIIVYKNLLYIRNKITKTDYFKFFDFTISSFLLKDELLWLLSYKHGFFKFNIPNENLEYIGLKETFGNHITEINNKLYIATDNGLYIYPLEKTITKYLLPYPSIEQEIKSISIKQKDQIKVVFNYNNNKYIGTPHFLLLVHKNNQVDTLLNTRVQSIYVIDTNNIWFGNNTGLYQLKNKYIYYYGDSSKLLNTLINDIYFKNNILWVATNGNGIVGIENGKIKYKFNKTNGLISDFTHCIRLDAHNIMWVGTNQGISRIENYQNEAYIYNYTSLDGLENTFIKKIDIFNDSIFFISKENNIYVIPSNAKKEIIKPSISFIKTEINNKIYTNNPNFLKIYSDDKITFQFLSSTFPNKLKHYEFIINHDTIISSDNKITLSNLSPGNYTIRVNVVNNENIKSNKPIIIEFSVKLKWYYTLYFRLIIIMLIIILAIHIAKIQIKKVKKKYEAQAEITNLKLKNLYNQFNPHFIDNTLNGILNLIRLKELSKLETYINTLSRYIRILMKSNQQNDITIENEIKLLENYIQLESFRLPFTIQYQINNENIQNPDFIKIPSMCILPFVENSIKHKSKENHELLINIAFQLTENKLIVIVQDNNTTPIQDFKTNGTGFGLELVQKRLEFFNKSFYTFENIYNQQNQISGVKIKINFNL